MKKTVLSVFAIAVIATMMTSCNSPKLDPFNANKEATELAIEQVKSATNIYDLTVATITLKASSDSIAVTNKIPMTGAETKELETLKKQLYTVIEAKIEDFKSSMSLDSITLEKMKSTTIK